MEAVENTQDSNMNTIPIEVLEYILKKLDVENIKICRLVCKQWNLEIIAHVEFGLIIKDFTSVENVEFVNAIRLPKSLRILDLKLTNCSELHKLKKGTLAKVTLLSFKFPYLSQPIINLKFFGNGCHSLTSLKFHRPILVTCDLEQECGHSISTKSNWFPYLSTIYIRQIDDYFQRVNGKEVELLSKNISYLCKILDVQLKVLDLRMNASYCDINSCIARLPFRFEDVILPTFISQQQSLEELILDIPIFMPNRLWPNSVSSFPVGLKYIEVKNKCGVSGVTEEFSQIVEFSELLDWDDEFYDFLDDPPLDGTSFWKQFLLAQEKLEILAFQYQGNLGAAELVPMILKNNERTLTKFMIETNLSGTIDTYGLQNSKLKTFIMNNRLFDWLVQHGEGDLFLKNMRNLPQTLTCLHLLNVVLEWNEIIGVAEFKSLKSFHLIYSRSHYMSLVEMPYFDELISFLFHLKSLDDLLIGLIYVDIVNIAKYLEVNEIDQFLLLAEFGGDPDLDEWAEDEDDAVALL